MIFPSRANMPSRRSQAGQHHFRLDEIPPRASAKRSCDDGRLSSDDRLNLHSWLGQICPFLLGVGTNMSQQKKRQKRCKMDGISKSHNRVGFGRRLILASDSHSVQSQLARFSSLRPQGNTSSGVGDTSFYVMRRMWDIIANTHHRRYAC